MTAPLPCSIGVLARAPVPGQAKTRLIPRLGASGAADLQRQLTAHAIATVSRARFAHATLWCTPDCEHESFGRLREAHGVRLHPQCAGDLGSRMADAIAAGLARAPAALIIGTDCPAIDEPCLRDAATVLAGPADVVLIPVEDGGYALIGMRRLHPGLFEAMPWGTDRVFAATLERAHALHLRVAVQPMLWDVDRPQDYDRLARAFSSFLVERTA